MSKSILYDYDSEELQKMLNESNSYSDLLRKVGLTSKGRNPDTLKKIIKEYNLDETLLNENRSKLYSDCAMSTHLKVRYPTEDILNGKHPNYQSHRLIKRLVNEGYLKYECLLCGNVGMWNGKQLTLQLDHIDGNRNNNALENLRILCPNCHSQTDTYAGKSSRNNLKSNLA